MTASAKNNKCKDYNPNYFVIKKIAKTVIHSITILHMRYPLLVLKDYDANNYTLASLL